MMIKFVPNKIGGKYYEIVREIYNYSFPVYERFDYEKLVELSQVENSYFDVVLDEDKVVGLSLTVDNKNASYLFYLAIAKEFRHKGYGTAIVQHLIESKRKTIFLGMEPLDEKSDNYDERVKRYNFYKKCGLHLVPNHFCKEGPMEYAILQSDDRNVASDYDEIMCNFFTKDFVKKNGVKYLIK